MRKIRTKKILLTRSRRKIKLAMAVCPFKTDPNRIQAPRLLSRFSKCSDSANSHPQGEDRQCRGNRSLSRTRNRQTINELKNGHELLEGPNPRSPYCGEPSGPEQHAQWSVNDSRRITVL